MMKSNNIPQEILNNEAVQYAIQCINVMWDVRSEKNHIEKVNWLDGICPLAEKTIKILVKSFANGDDTLKIFARKLANV